MKEISDIQSGVGGLFHLIPWSQVYPISYKLLKFIFMAELYSMACKYHVFFILVLIDIQAADKIDYQKLWCFKYGCVSLHYDVFNSLGECK